MAYVRFATAHRAHFDVMFRPDLYRAGDPQLLEAQSRAETALYGGIRELSKKQAGPDHRVAGIAAWSIVHGFASLWLTHSLPPELGDDPEASARAVAALLFRPE